MFKVKYNLFPSMGFAICALVFLLLVSFMYLSKKKFKNLENNKRAQIIIETIIKMCKKLKIKTVAEGIETKEQVDFLKKVGCDIIQGYYFSKPITISEFEEKYLK